MLQMMSEMDDGRTIEEHGRRELRVAASLVRGALRDVWREAHVAQLLDAGGDLLMCHSGEHSVMNHVPRTCITPYGTQTCKLRLHRFPHLEGAHGILRRR